jgi:hypothetical protein
MTERVTEFVAKAAAAPIELTVRDLLAIWGFRTRSYESVGRIQQDLSAVGLQCQPDFTEGPADTVVRIGYPPSPDDAQTNIGPEAAAAFDTAVDEPLRLPSSSIYVRDIPSAINGVESVHPDETLELAQTRMLAKDYSQLAVKTGPTELKGAVSWMTIATARIARSSLILADVIDSHPKVVRADEKLLNEISTISAADFAFVQDGDACICGIVTAADLANQFQDLAIPFFQLGEIEGRLRHCIERVFTLEELRAGTGKKKLKSADDMTFGDYVFLLKADDRWRRMHFRLDHGMFIAYLDDARELRNRVMHFGAELKAADKRKLVSVLNFMRNLDPRP